MKQIILFVLMFVSLHANISAQLPDLPSSGATSYGRQTLPVGSYIIAMDNVNQRIGNSGTDFNLRAYGAVVYLLNNNIKVKWVIRPGKAADGIDFTVARTQLLGTAQTGSNNFISGAFVIFQQDTAGVVALLQSFNGAVSTDDVKLYKTTALPSYPDPINGQVDVRYDYFMNGVVFKPMAAVLNDGGNYQIQQGYLTEAGITTANYSIEVNTTFITSCYTFASEPHNEAAPDNVIQGIRQFVAGGGNFLAECAAVRKYEGNSFGRFQTVNGFTDENGTPNTVAQTNVDLAYFQIQGGFDMSQGGSLRSWEMPINANRANSFYAFTSGVANNQTWTNATASKLLPASKLGGMVFYLGGHEYKPGSINGDNGVRMYLNAFLIPTNPQGSLVTSAVTHCATYPNMVTVDCGSSFGPASAYPLTFTLYEDKSPAGYTAGDIPMGNIVTFTAPNTAVGGITTITAPASLNSSNNYVVAIRPAAGCLQAKYFQSFCSILPVEMMNFTAKRNGSLVDLKWTTASEQNNRGFDIVRLTGNGNWETVGYVASKAEAGISSGELNYAFTDPNNFKGITQYRIKQTDLDGRSKYSEIRSVQGEIQKENLIVFPNPSAGTVNILFGDDTGVSRNVDLFDMSGRMVKEWKSFTSNNLQINGLAPGMYTIHVLVPANGANMVEKIVITQR